MLPAALSMAARARGSQACSRWVAKEPEQGRDTHPSGNEVLSSVSAWMEPEILTPSDLSHHTRPALQTWELRAQGTHCGESGQVGGEAQAVIAASRE